MSTRKTTQPGSAFRNFNLQPTNSNISNQYYSSPFQSSFRPTPTAATVTPAAAAGTTATAAGPGSTGSTTSPTSTAESSAIQAPSAATATAAAAPSMSGFFSSTRTTTPAFSSAAATTPLAFSASTAPSSTPGLFGSTATAAPMTNTGLFGSTSTATPSTATANGLFGSTSTATPSTAATSVTFGSATSTPTAAESSGVITLDNRSANTAGPRSIRFTFQWDPTQVTSTKSHTLTVRSISPESYQFLCSVKRVEDCFLFNVKCLLEKDFLAMQWVTYATINTPDGMVRNTKVVKHWPQSRMINLSDPMPSGRFSKNLSGMLAVDIVLSNDTSVLSGTFGDTSNYSHSDSILARMLDESDSHDVFFEFEVPESTYEEWEVEECDEDAGALKSDIDDHESANDENDDENASEEDVDDEDKDDEDKDDATANGEDDEIVTVNAEDKGKGIRKDTVSEGESDNNPKSSDNAKTILIPVTTTKNTRTEIVGAHKVVLSHFEYFKTMFSSSFAEGGPGIKRIKIQDTDIFCFRLLIEFLYLGRLRRGTLPMVLTEDQAKDHLPTWEDVYLVADRYDVPQLRRMAVDRILLGLDSQWAVDFLFRTAYLFEDLRLPVIRFVVRKSMSSIVNKSVQQTFYDHPECSSVFGEIIAELWAKSTL